MGGSHEREVCGDIREGRRILCRKILAPQKFDLEECDANDQTQNWKGDAFVRDENFHMPEYSARKKLRRQRWEV